MFIYQNGKLYTQDGDKLVGVEIYSDKVLSVEGSETELSDEYEMLTPFEVRCKFQIADTPYIFPREIKEEQKVEEVKKDDTTGTPKRTARKSTSK